MVRDHVKYAHWIYARVTEYCDVRISFGGSHVQGDYKEDFIRIFVDAFCLGLCGLQARRSYAERLKRLKRKKPTYSDYVITGHSIREHLEEHWFQGHQRNERMVDDLCQWWDSWTYAFQYFPGDLWSPRWRLRKIKASMVAWGKYRDGLTESRQI